MKSELNPQQRAAVRLTGAPLLVLAGAGSGKTRVISRRVVWLVRHHGVYPAAITAVTFTNKAAREMAARVAADLGGSGRGPTVTVSTFHRLGLGILREHGDRLGLRRGFSLLDGRDCVSIVAELLRDRAIAGIDLAERVHGRLSAWKNDGRTEDAMAAAGTDPVERAAAALYRHYQRFLLARNAVDLDDLILLPARLLAADDALLERWRERIRYLLVDEYQDTNGAQYELLRLLAGHGAGLTVVGDDDQSIYAWRGARPDNLARLAADFPDLVTIKLEQNYRSAGRILKLANGLIANNPRPFGKSLWSDLGYGDPVRVLVAGDDFDEAGRVVSDVLRRRFVQRARAADIAILYRGNHQARVFEEKLREAGVPYRLSGGRSFFDRAEVRDVLAYLRLAANPDDDNAFLRVANTPRRGIGASTLERLAAVAAKDRTSLLDAAASAGLETVLTARARAALFSFRDWAVTMADQAQRADAGEVARTVVRECGYEAWLEQCSESPEDCERRRRGVADLLDWIERAGRRPDGAGNSLRDALASVLLAGILDREQDDGDGDEVALMTLHAAKGLEFDHVYIVGVEEGLLPHRNSDGDGGIEEERRLFYVGITRARRTLTLSMARRRRRYGEQVDCQPSRFIDELPADDLEWHDAGAVQRTVETGRAHLAGIRALLGGS